MEIDGLSMSLLLAAAGIALTHTLLGPDHYLPFLMLARARGWSRPHAVAVSVLCGAGHVLSSLALGAIGLLLGFAVGRLEQAERARGDLAAWALTAFGAAYALWGARRSIREARGLRVHEHAGAGFWTLFILFVLGPCEPLIPLFMLPASRGRWALAGLTAVLYGVLTIGFMAALTYAGVSGLRRLPLGPLERWADTLAGAAIAGSGLAIVTLRL